MKKLAVAIISLALVASTAASAKPRKHHRHHRHHHHAMAVQQPASPISSFFGATAAAEPRSYRRHQRRGRVAVRPQPSSFGSAFAGAAIGGDLVSRARNYLGQTAAQVGVRRNLWCGAFLNKVAGGGTGSDLAKSWLAKPRTSPRVGAIAVMGRGRGGGHVGVVSGFDGSGNPIIISGNHNRRVGEAVYPKSRVIAYVTP
jgi:uncharacterized protein (TIGR02594 family)